MNTVFLNAPYNTPYQCTLSIHPINTSDQYTLSVYLTIFPHMQTKLTYPYLTLLGIQSGKAKHVDDAPLLKDLDRSVTSNNDNFVKCPVKRT